MVLDPIAPELIRTASTTYYHLMLAGAIVHPDRKEVIALATESITKQDGTKKE